MMDLDSLVAKMRELGIRHYKNGDVEVLLDDAKPTRAPGQHSEQDSDLFGLKAAAERKAQQNRIMFGASSMIPRFEKKDK